MNRRTFTGALSGALAALGFHDPKYAAIWLDPGAVHYSEDHPA